MADTQVKDAARAQAKPAAPAQAEAAPAAAGQAAASPTPGPECAYSEAKPQTFVPERFTRQSIWRAEGQTHTIRVEPLIYEIAAEAGIPKESVPDLIVRASRPEAQEKAARTIQEKLTVERIDRWLETDKGRRWLANNRQAVNETFKERVRTGAPGLAVCVLSLLGAMELADVIGVSAIHQPEEHFAIVIGVMHTTGTAVQKLGSGLPAMARIIEQRMVGKGAEAVLEVTIQSRNAVGRAIAGAIKMNFGGKQALATVARGGASIIRMPATIAYGIGPGLLACAVTEAVLPEGMDYKTRGGVVFGAFFVPDVLRIALGRRGVAAARAFRLPAAARLASIAFLIDLGVMATHRLSMGEQSAYMRSIAMRAGDEAWQESEDLLFRTASDAPIFAPAALVLAGLGKVTNLLMPVTIATCRTIGDDYDGEARVARVLKEDEDASRAMLDELPYNIFDVLRRGVGDESMRPEFYNEVDLAALTKEVKGDDSDLREALSRLVSGRGFSALSEEQKIGALAEIYRRYPEQASVLNARELQETLASLHFIHLPMNDRIRRMVDEDGALLKDEGARDEIMRVVTNAVPGARDPEMAMNTILELRRLDLVTKFLAAESPSDRRSLASVAMRAGLMDRSGVWEPTPTYFSALNEWGRMSRESEEGARRVHAYAGILNQAYSMSDDIGRKNMILMELAVLGFGDQIALSGSDYTEEERRES